MSGAETLVVAAGRVALVPAEVDAALLRDALEESVEAALGAAADAAWCVIVDGRGDDTRVLRRGAVPVSIVGEPEADPVSEYVEEAPHDTLLEVSDDDRTGPDPEEAPAGDHDGATITLAELRARRAAQVDPIPEGDHDGATLSIDQLRARRAAAPAVRLGRIRLSTGESFDVDRPIVIGRSPRATRVALDDAPQLVPVPSPQLDISRNHLEIRPDADAVVVTDLRTTNGTMLLREGADPVRLRGGERTVVVTGDVLDLGDGVTVEFEDVT